ncbi:MAG: hypothetical protein A2W23_05920 [Planctomycetes bacterium RBG_16_43_13]|nr:MAG: hypothetical protein A2W23_05920 [Planctomycetes bacterium RBG_16_43_13]
MSKTSDTYSEYAKTVLRVESDAILSLIPRIDSNFVKVITMLLNCKGRVVVTGMGKAGIIAQKLSATFASTGTPSLYLHPADAYHGDLGRVTKDDIVVTLSNSGETEEIVRLIPHIKKIGAGIVSITSDKKSTLGAIGDVTLAIGNIEEACPLGLAPSASTTAMLALGDAIALTILKERGFDAEKFAFYHPGGKLGIKLLKVEEVMRTGDRSPAVRENVTVKEALLAITTAKAGAVNVVDMNGKLVGIFTDGDLRRKINADIATEVIGNVMTKSPKTISSTKLATEALAVLRDKKIDELPVVDENGMAVGMLDIQDLLDVGLV